MRKSEFVSRGGILVAMSLALLYLGSISPGGKFGCCAAAGMVVSLPLIQRRVKLSVSVYIITTVAGAVILPVKSVVFWYALGFGLYALVKYRAESIRRYGAELALKLAYFNAMVLFAIGLVRAGVFAFADWMWNIRASAVILVLNAFFILYDVAFSRLIGLMRHMIFHNKF